MNSSFIKKNLLFILLFAVLIFALGTRFQKLSAPIVSQPDSYIEFSGSDRTLEQTWQTTSKYIEGVHVPYVAECDMECDMQVRIFSDDEKELIVSQPLHYSLKKGEQGTLDFPFKRIAVSIGDRYRIRLSMTNPSTDGVIRISSGTNYDGCFVNGKDVGQGAAFTIDTAKYSSIFWIVSSMLPILAGSLMLMMLTKRKYEETVALSVFAEGIILYFFGLTGHLRAGVAFVYAVSVILVICTAFIFNMKKYDLKDIISPGLIIYIIFVLVIIVGSKGEWLGNRDELRHWGIAVRDMFFYDSFANHQGTTLILGRYEPFAAVIEYVFEYMNGIFSEDILFISYQIMILSVMSIIFRPLQKDRKSFVIPTLITLVCVPILFFNNLSSCIMVDSFMAVTMAYALICYYTEEMNLFNMIRIACALAAIVLTKDMGLVFAGLTVLIMFGDTAVRQLKNRKLEAGKLLYTICCGFMVIGLFISWQIYLERPAAVTVHSSIEDSPMTSADTNTEKGSGVVKDTSYDDAGERKETDDGEQTDSAISASGITLSGIKNVITGKGEDYQYKVARKYITEIFDGKTYVFGSLALSFGDLLAIACAVTISLGYFGFWGNEKERMNLMVILILIMAFLICSFTLMTYWFSFTMYDAVDLTSFGRYHAPYLCAIFILVMYLIINRQSERNEDKKFRYVIWFISFMLIICMPISGIVEKSRMKDDSTIANVTYGHDNIAEILHSIADKGDRAYFICSDSDGYSEYIFRNTVCPIVSDHVGWNITANKELSDEQHKKYGKEGKNDDKAEVMTSDAWERKLMDCQYLVVFHADEFFKESYQKVFNGTEIKDGSIYRIENCDDGVKLQMIGSTGIKDYH